MHWHVVNLERRPERWRTIQALDLPMTRFDAVDAKTFDSNFRNRLPHESDAEYAANVCAVAVSMSHARLLEYLLTLPGDVFGVMEDDCHVPDVPRLNLLVDEFCAQGVCNLVNLGVGHIKPEEHEAISPHLRRSTGRSICTQCYLIKRDIIPAVVGVIHWGISQMIRGGDRRKYAQDVLWVFAEGVVQCIPESPAAVQSGAPSDVQVKDAAASRHTHPSSAAKDT